MDYCCERFAENASRLGTLVGGGIGLYPEAMKPKAQFECLDDGWAIYGCCGGGCFVVTGMNFCPFCGEVLKRHAKTS